MTDPARPYPGTAPAPAAEPGSESEPAESAAPVEPLSLPDLALRSIGSAVAIADPGSWEILFENGLFFEWFGPDAETEAPLSARIEGLDLEAVTAKLDKGRRFTWETDVTSGARPISTEIEIRRIKHEERDLALVEARNISKRKEAEYKQPFLPLLAYHCRHHTHTAVILSRPLMQE